MIILQKYKLVWSSVPRTGTLSMIKLLRKYGGVVIPKCHRHKVPKEYNTFHKFMIVRNPYTRLLSWWQWWKIGHDSRIPTRPDETFKEFLIWLNKNKHIHTGAYYYSYDNQTAFGKAFNCNTYLYLENLPADFKKIHCLRDAEEHWENAPGHKFHGKRRPLNKYYGKEEIALLHQHSGPDFERFGYDL